MPATLNGIGISVCRARGVVGWGGRPDFDGVSCFVIFGMPIFPGRAVHTFNWRVEERSGHGRTYAFQGLQIARSSRLVFLAFARRWVPCLFGLFLAALWILGGDPLRHSGPPENYLGGEEGYQADLRWTYALSAGAVMSLLGMAGLWSADRRDKKIRRVLGRHIHGSSDPAHWMSSQLCKLPGPAPMFGKNRYWQAAEAELAAGRLSSAMWAARLETALGDKAAGERLTDLILADERVRSALRSIGGDWSRWEQFFGPRPEHVGAPSADPVSSAEATLIHHRS